jgi:cell division protein FtsL
MSAYTRGNLAVKEAARQPVPSTRTHAAPQPVRRTMKLSSGEKFLYLLCGLIVTVALGGIVMISSQIYEVNKTTHDMKGQLQAAVEENGTLKNKLDKALNPETLLTEAGQYGFKQVNQGQIATSYSNKNDKNSKKTTALSTKR